MSLDRLIPEKLREQDRIAESDPERNAWERENCPHPASLYRRVEVVPPADRPLPSGQE